MFTELEFLEAIRQFALIVDEPREYRLHYNTSGGIYLCTCQNHPKDTKYLVVDETTYSEYYKYHVVDGKLKIIDLSPDYRVQLKSSDRGYPVVKNHAGVVLENEQFNDIEYYESN